MSTTTNSFTELPLEKMRKNVFMSNKAGYQDVRKYNSTIGSLLGYFDKDSIDYFSEDRNLGHICDIETTKYLDVFILIYQNGQKKFFRTGQKEDFLSGFFKSYEVLEDGLFLLDIGGFHARYQLFDVASFKASPSFTKFSKKGDTYTLIPINTEMKCFVNSKTMEYTPFFTFFEEIESGLLLLREDSEDGPHYVSRAGTFETSKAFDAGSFGHTIEGLYVLNSSKNKFFLRPEDMKCSEELPFTTVYNLFTSIRCDSKFGTSVFFNIKNFQFDSKIWKHY